MLEGDPGLVQPWLAAPGGDDGKHDVLAAAEVVAGEVVEEAEAAAETVVEVVAGVDETVAAAVVAGGECVH